MVRSYSDLRRIESFEDRYQYLSLRGRVGEKTFGFERYINQKFYRSSEWRALRTHILVRDQGWDLGVTERYISDRPIIHHMNPMTIQDLERGNSDILDPEFLITTSHHTHNAIHYGDASLLPRPLVERKRGDTKLW